MESHLLQDKQYGREGTGQTSLSLCSSFLPSQLKQKHLFIFFFFLMNCYVTQKIITRRLLAGIKVIPGGEDLTELIGHFLCVHSGSQMQNFLFCLETMGRSDKTEVTEVEVGRSKEEIISGQGSALKELGEHCSIRLLPHSASPL